ncbi:hypothetical protein [uncultured Nocardioides sp.]|uniref:hypothetical protein n=1 Tax=uncultured Nocardioides sp. TaxID=198441 RepID=UPI00262C3FD9|nr:hypothetical protein [uncultured Nocardioides sp.]
MQRYERLWERLLTLLGTLGDVDVDADTPGRLRLTIDRREVEIVMTEADWGELVTIPYGSFAGAALHLLHAISQAGAVDAPFLVYDTYDLHPCATPQPEEPELEAERLRFEARRAVADFQVAVRAYPPGEEPT